MYPLDRLPGWLAFLVRLNPLTYGVDLLRGVILGLPANYALDVAVLAFFAAGVLAVAVHLFNQEGK